MSAATARRRWARRMIGQHQNPPRYGSPEWLALPDGSPAKVAAVVLAAECWAVDGDDLADRLETEVRHEREAFKRTEDAEYAARAEAHRQEWERAARMPTPFAGQRAPVPLEVAAAEYVRALRGGAA